MTYDEVVTRLQAIEADLANMDGKAAEVFYRAKRQYEHDHAVAYMRTEGTVEERRQRTILGLWQSDAYKAFVAAEAAWEAQKAVQRTLETRASIGQSLLRAMTRESPQGGEQPAWSKHPDHPKHFSRKAA